MATLQYFWLKWNSHQELLGSLEQLLASESFVDVTIAVEGHMLKAHRVILCACSPYFNSILQTNPNQHPIIFMRDVKHIEMKALLDFIYKGEVYVSQENIAGVMKTAEALCIKGLTNICWNSYTNAASGHHQERRTEKSHSTAESSDIVEEHSSGNEAVVECKAKLPDKKESIESECRETTKPGESESQANTVTLQIASGDGEGTETRETVSLLPSAQEIVIQDILGGQSTGHLSVTSSDSESTVTILGAPGIKISPVPISLMKVPHTQLSTKHKRQYTKKDMEEALERIRKGEMGIKPAARFYNIPVATLHHAARRSKITSPMQQGGNKLPCIVKVQSISRSSSFSPD